jgi:NitT/TauT family transport system ATP-binding protein/nitrate/nitrite transport system substrate-binding protein
VSFSGEFRLGFLALTDAAPLIVADRLDLFAEQGLRVSLHREVSWATLRDKLTAGLLDGAHMLAQIAVAARLGAGGVRADLIAPMALNVNGAGVTLSMSMLDQIGADSLPDAQPLAEVAARRRKAGADPLTFGIVFAFSTHAYLLRDWLARGGVDPDQDVRLRVLPPTAMVERMRVGELDGFCVGAPWNAVAQAQGAGRLVARASALDPSGPDKVFAVDQAWAERNAEPLQAMLRALKLAALWADDQHHRQDLLRILAEPQAVGAPANIIAQGLARPGAEGGVIFAAGGLGRPDPAHAWRIVDQLRRWGQISDEADGAASSVYRPDLFDTASV